MEKGEGGARIKRKRRAKENERQNLIGSIIQA